MLGLCFIRCQFAAASRWPTPGSRGALHIDPCICAEMSGDEKLFQPYQMRIYVKGPRYRGGLQRPRETLREVIQAIVASVSRDCFRKTNHCESYNQFGCVSNCSPELTRSRRFPHDNIPGTRWRFFLAYAEVSPLKCAAAPHSQVKAPMPLCLTLSTTSQ